MIFADGQEYSERLDYFDEISSTQDFLKEKYSQQKIGKLFHWVRANFQTAGRGRMGRRWDSNKGGGLLCSVALNSELFDQAQANAQFLPFVSLVSLCESLEVLVGGRQNKFFVKWPNDILWFSSMGVKKLSGILVEAKGRNLFVVGWGINIRGSNVIATAANLEEILNASFSEESVDEFFHSLRSRFYSNLESWLARPRVYEKQIIESLRSKWMQAFWGREILVNGEKFEALDLEDSGNLKCRSYGDNSEKSISCSHSLEMDLEIRNVG